MLALYQRLAGRESFEPTRRVLAGLAGRLLEALPASYFLLPYKGGWRISAHDRSTFVLSKARTSMYLDRYHAFAALREYQLWQKWYLPPFSLKGLTVLDVGAGCGETASLFFENGASKVIAVDSDRRLEEYLAHNATRNNWNLEIHLERFAAEHTEMRFDFAKLDCEGGEVVLLSSRVREMPPFRIEMHVEPEGASRLISKFGLRYVGGDNVWGSC